MQTPTYRTWMSHSTIISHIFIRYTCNYRHVASILKKRGVGYSIEKILDKQKNHLGGGGGVAYYSCNFDFNVYFLIFTSFFKRSHKSCEANSIVIHLYSMLIKKFFAATKSVCGQIPPPARPMLQASLLRINLTFS